MDTFNSHFDNDNKCINIIYEFLVHYEFNSTLASFLSETPRLGFTLPEPAPENKPHIRRDDITRILSTFQSENYKQFFEIWHMTIPSPIKDLKDYKRLTFHLYVYFATLPFRRNRKKIIPIEIVEIVDDNSENEKVENKTIKFEPELDRISETCEKPTSNENAVSTDEEDNNNVVTALDKKFTTFKDLGEGLNNVNESLVINTSEESVKKIINSNYKEYGGKSPAKFLQPDKEVVINVSKHNSVTPEETGSSRNSIDSLEVFKIDASGRFREVRNSIDSLEVLADARIESSTKFIEAEINNSTIEQEEKAIIDKLVEKAINNNQTELVFINNQTETKSNKLDKENDINSANNSVHVLEDINIDFIEKEKNSVDNYNKINILKNNDNISPIEIDTSRGFQQKDEVPIFTSEETINNNREDVIVDSNETAMDVLKKFLTTKGPEFSSEPEFLPFFALPFINNPKEHPSFMDIFKESWAETLEKRLIDFVEQYSYGESVAPKLIKQCSKPIASNNNSRVSSARLTSINDIDGNRRYKNLKHKFQKLHRDHQNLIGVAAELTTALENSVRGQAVDLKATLCNCVKIFPELFSKPGEDTMTFQIKKDYGHEYNRVNTTPCYHLDVQKIKQHLATGSMKTKLLLIQALRWRLTRSNNEERDHTVLWLSQHDILSLRATVVEDMLAPPGACTPHPLQQAVSRLLNAVASLRCGRDYLSPSHALLTLLMATLQQQRGVKIDHTTADMLLATLQKLSLRKNQRIGMIENGMVEWLIEKMKSEQNRSYTLEYSSALLMNLCLHNEARQRFPPLLLTTLIQLLDSPHTQIVPVISGTLYCLLTRDEVNNVAKDLNLERTIQVHIQRFSAEPAMVRQLETLLKLHKGELPPDAIQTISEEPNEDEMEDPDELERELDFDDPVRAMPGDLSGDDLLNTLYSCPSSDMCH
ncbi:hypothetical protein LSTR_LSTR004097 [Laodelphax striatellus]|uniref:LisH domain-containing protein ARMC9 n=1 Tax=Laodelphax striatellus TaxID=195883 RepID=A0A482WGK8_LAOST|nr:hypothetical protein LSTR_LSTR004097 [Laodelphax striatellus]